MATEAFGRAKRRRRSSVEFWLYFTAIFPIALIVAAVSRLLPRSWRPFSEAGRGVFGDAKAAAFTVLPFVFMG